MVLRNVAKTFSLEEQRQEINEIAADLHALDTTISSINFSGYLTAESDTLDSVTGRGATTTNALTVGGLLIGDDDGTKAKSIKLGDDDDLTLFYDGRVGYVTSYIESDQMIIRPKTTPSDTFITFLEGGPVQIYHGSNTRISTSATGASIFGALTAGGLTYPTTNGTSGDVLTSDGAGNVTWSAVSPSSSYADSDVDLHLNVSGANAGEILSWNGSDYAWVADQTGGGGGGIALTDFSVTTNTAGTAALSYDDSNGVFSYTPPDLSGYLTSETSHADVVVDGDFTTAGLMTSDGSGGYSITTNNASNWDTAYGWGDHASAGYLTSETSHADVVVDGDFTSQGLMKRDATSGSYSIVTDNSANWDTAYGWGDHASAGYLTSQASVALNDVTDVTITSPSNGEILTYNGSAWVNSTNSGGSGGSGTLSVTTSNAGKAYVDAVPGTFTAYGVNVNDVEQNTPTYTNTDGTTTVPVTNPVNHPDPVSLAFDGRDDTFVDVTSTVDGGVVELVFTNPVAEFNLTRLILGFDGNIECGFNGGNYVTASVTGSVTELTVTSAGSQTLDKLTFRTPTAAGAIGNLYYVIASYPNGWTGGTNSRLTIKQTDISVGSSGTGDNQLIMHDGNYIIQLTPSDVNKVVAVKTDIPREIILPAGTLMTPGDTVTVIDVGYGALDRNDTNNYPQATGAGFPYMTYNSGNAQNAPIKIYPSRDEGIQGTNIQPWNQPNSISNYTQSQTSTGYYVPEPFHGMPFAIKRNGGSIRLMWIGPAYGWRILP